MSTKTKNPPAAPEVKKQLSPAELAEELLNIVDSVGTWQENQKIEEAEKVLARAKERAAKIGEKRLRIMRAKSIEEAQAILAENPVDDNLKKLCQRLSGWKPLQEKGAMDGQIWGVLSDWPCNRPYDEKIPQAAAGFGNGSAEAWVDEDKPKSSLKGPAMIAAVRRVMKIDKPAGGETAAKKAPAPKKPAPKKPAPRKPAKAPAKEPAPPAEAEDDDAAINEEADRIQRDFDAGEGARKAAKEKAKPQAEAGIQKNYPPDITKPVAAAAKPKQTWRQWASTLAKVDSDYTLSPKVPEFSSPTEREEFFLGMHRAGKSPSEALEAWEKCGEESEIAREVLKNDPTEGSKPYDANVNGKGEYVDGVSAVEVANTARFRIEIYLAQGIDGLYRTGHLMEFKGGEAAQMDDEVQPRQDGQAVESGDYAVRARANIIMNQLQKEGLAETWTPAQRSSCAAAIAAVKAFLAKAPKSELQPV